MIYKRREGLFRLVPKLSKKDKRDMFSPSPVNYRQELLCYALMDDSINTITVVGPAGTGKSLLIMAAAYHQREKYDEVIFYKPLVSIGKDPGTLPGDLQQKLAPWKDSIDDNLLLATGCHSMEEACGNDSWFKFGAIAHARGRSVRGFVFIDEAQNLDSQKVKTLVSRAGEGSKVVLAGDIDQVDNSKLNRANNGLMRLVHHLKRKDAASHIELTENERKGPSLLVSDFF